jgi:ligand-binding sensor domain-containing protein
MKQLTLSLSFMLSVHHDASAETRIPVEEVSVLANSLPEFKEDPWNRESEGNQISGVVRVVFQDQSERFWFGGEGGLQRYDGTDLVFYDIRDELDKGHTVKAIDEDGDGNIWVAATNGLFKYDGEFFTRFTAQDGLSSNDVWDVLVDSSGVIWSATFEGICRIDGDTFTRIPIPAATERNYNKGVWGPNVVWSIAEDRAGRLWFLAESGVYIYNEETLSEVSATELGPGGNVSEVLEDTKGRIWFATGSGLVLFDERAFTNITQNEGLGDLGVSALCEDSRGRIWFAAGNTGVYRYDGTSFTKFSAEEGLRAMVFCIVEDSERRVWLVGRRGAYRYDQQSFINVTRDGPW